MATPSDVTASKLTEETTPTYVWYSLAYDLAAAAISISLYYEYDGEWLDGNGLYASSIVGIALTIAKMLAMKACDKKIGVMDWFMLGTFVLIGLPALLLDNEFLLKLQSPIISAMAFCAFAGVTINNKEPVIKQFTKDHIFRMFALPYMSARDVNRVPDEAWRKVDYCNMADFFVSAIAGAAVAYWCNKEEYLLAKYALGCVSLLNFAAQYTVLTTCKVKI